MWLIKRLFHDKRCTVGLLLLWMLTVCTIFYVLGAFHMSYMHIGPGEDTVFMGLKIDSWGKWMALAIFSFCNTGINEFISNALDPWFVNSLQDHKTRSIEYSHATCLWIVQIHCIYVHVMGIFALFLFFSQVDFAIIRLLADLLVTGYSTVWFIQNKRVVPAAAAASGGYHEENAYDQQQHLMAATHCRYDHASEYDDEVVVHTDDVIKLNLHCDDSSGKQFAIFDIHEEDGEGNGDEDLHPCCASPIKRISAAILATAPKSDAIVGAEGGNEDEHAGDEDILPLSLSSSTKPAQPRGKPFSSQSPAKRKLHPRLPSQTTVCQRNEDTRP